MKKPLEDLAAERQTSRDGKEKKRKGESFFLGGASRIRGEGGGGKKKGRRGETCIYLRGIQTDGNGKREEKNPSIESAVPRPREAWNP